MMIPMLVKKKSQRDLSSIQLGSAVFVPDMEKKTRKSGDLWRYHGTKPSNGSLKVSRQTHGLSTG